MEPNTDMFESCKDGINTRPPYVLEYNKLCALFDGDKNVKIGFLDNETRSCVITVTDGRRANFLRNHLNLRHLKFCLSVVGEDDPEGSGEAELAHLLENNPYFVELYKSRGSASYSAVLVAPEVVPVDTDNAFAPSGCDAYTPQQLLRELFHGSHINIQTDL